MLDVLNIHSINSSTGNVLIQKEQKNLEMKIITLLINFGGNKTVRNR